MLKGQRQLTSYTQVRRFISNLIYRYEQEEINDRQANTLKSLAYAILHCLQLEEKQHEIELLEEVEQRLKENRRYGQH